MSDEQQRWPWVVLSTTQSNRRRFEFRELHAPQGMRLFEIRRFDLATGKEFGVALTARQFEAMLDAINTYQVRNKEK